MNECISEVEESIKSYLVLLLWNILNFVKRVVQMCIYIMYMATDKDKCVFHFYFIHVAMNRVMINFMTVILHTPPPDVYAPDSVFHYFW